MGGPWMGWSGRYHVLVRGHKATGGGRKDRWGGNKRVGHGCHHAMDHPVNFANPGCDHATDDPVNFTKRNRRHRFHA